MKSSEALEPRLRGDDGVKPAMTAFKGQIDPTTLVALALHTPLFPMPPCA
jgi:hypothetical protein